MGAVAMVARAELRRRWRSVVVLTVLVGIVAAVVLTAVAGARRTSSAFGRFRAETLAPDLVVFAPASTPADLAALRRLPGVEAIAPTRQLLGTLGGSPANVAGAFDRSLGRVVERPRLLDGRRARADRIDEITVPEPLARAAGVHVGQSVVFRGFTQEQVLGILDGTDPGDPAGPAVDLMVVGITREPGDLSLSGTTGGIIFFTPAFTQRYADEVGTFAGSLLIVRVPDDAAAQRFVREARRRLAPLGAQGEFQVQPTSAAEGAVRQSIDVSAAGLLVFAAIAALAGLVAIAAVVRRFVDDAGRDASVLRALGAHRRNRTVMAAGLVVPVAIGGALLGVVGAWLASPLMPLGLARKAEPTPGLDVDGLVLAAGFLATVLVVALAGFAAGRRAAAARPAEPRVVRRGAVARVRSTIGPVLAPAPTVGLALASDPGRGPNGVPSRPAFVGAAAAVTGLVAVAVFGASLGHLVESPSDWGYNWDAHVVVPRAPTDPDRPCTTVPIDVGNDRVVAAATAVCTSSLEVQGEPIDGYGLTRLSGAVDPTVLSGRVPRTVREVALGTTTADRIGARVGDHVEITGPRQSSTFRVVGRVVLPPLEVDEQAQSITDGAVFTGAGLEPLSDTDAGSSYVLVRWKPGADLAGASARVAKLPQTSAPKAPKVPLEVRRLRQLDVLPWVLGSFLGLIGILAVGYTLVTTVRRRRRDFAVLKSMGFVRHQVRTAVVTQSTLVVGVGAVVGVPLGLIAGRAVWTAVADDTGVRATTAVSGLVVTAVAVIAVVVAGLIATVPGRRAARLHPADAMRTE